jgi:ABC-type branched-subunit amino acid transport system substrate-binding protein
MMRHRDLRYGAVVDISTRRVVAALLTASIVQLAGTALAPTSAAIAGELSSSEARGKHIYTKGESPDRRVITARLQRTESAAPAAIIPCISCHGTDGRGSDDEVAVAPLEIDWRSLSAPEGHRHEQRAHGPFDEATVARAIIAGVDPDGNSLDAMMPRYNISDEDMADLIAYLKVIETQLDPGLSESRIRLGTVLPMEGQLAGVGRAIRDTLEAYFDTVNGSGGIHGRRLELVVAPWGKNDDPAIWQARDLLAAEPLFAIVSSHLPGYDAELAALAGEQQIPLIGPYTFFPPENGDHYGYGFYLLSGLAQQAEALVDAAVARLDPKASRLAVVHPLLQSFDTLADAVRQRAGHYKLEPVVTSTYALNAFDAGATVSTLIDARADAVVFLGSAAEFVQFGHAAERLGWQPLLLAPASLAEREVFDLPASFGGSVLLSYSTLPSDYSAAGAAEFEQLHDDYEFDYQHSAAQIAAYTAARLLVEGLERAGRALSRERLLHALERLDSFHAGLVPPLSYGPNRRIGSLGAYIVPVNLVTGRLEAPGAWIALDESRENARP